MAIYTPDGKSRPYSIASGTNEDVLRFLIRRLPQGEVTTRSLMQNRETFLTSLLLSVGFDPDKKNNRPRAFFATGTGIAPFLSYLLSSPKQQPLAIYYGISQQNDLFHLPLLENTGQLNLAISQEIHLTIMEE